MTRVKIIRRTVIDNVVWQGSQLYNVSDEELAKLIDAGAVVLETQDAGAAPENKAAPKRRGRPRKVKE